ncbi:MAG TPA: O-antigen ligase family protein, partial [Vicinamibacterales bacterium]|nr:O-antigen ligase family protein [Vicinamibacterales bacterium]
EAVRPAGARATGAPPASDRPEGTAAIVGRTDRAAARDRLAFAGLLAFTFVVFVRPQDHVPLLHLLHVADVTAVFALGALVAGRLGRGEPIVRPTPALLGVVAFAAVMLATVPFSIWPGGAFATFTGLYAKVVLLFFLMTATLATRERLARLLGVLVVGTSYIAGRAVLDYLRGANLVETGRLAGAVSGLFGNPNDLALTLVAILPLAVAFALSRGRPAVRVTSALGALLMAAAVVFTQSRGGSIGMVAMLGALVLGLRRIRPAAAALAVLAALAATPLLPDSYVERMASIFDAEKDPTGSREARKRLMREGYQAFLEHPLTGVGAGQFQNYKPEAREEAWRETHNVVLQVASELGAAGLAVFVFLVATAFRGAVSAVRRARSPAGRATPGADWLRLFGVALVASLVGWLVAAMFASVAYYWTFYYLLAASAAMADLARREIAPRRRTSPAGRRATASPVSGQTAGA